MPRYEPQHVTTYVGRTIDYETAARATLLLANLFLEFFVAFDISYFGSFPRFAKYQSTLFGIDLPECISDSCE